MNNATFPVNKFRLLVQIVTVLIGFGYKTNAQIAPDRGIPVSRTIHDFRVDSSVLNDLPSNAAADREIYGFVNHAYGHKDPKAARLSLEQALNTARNNPIPPLELKRALSNRARYSSPLNRLSGVSTDTTPLNRDEEILARNFTEKFVIPYKLSQVDLEEGKYVDGLKKLFSIYYDKSFTEKNLQLEEEIKKDIGVNSLGTNLVNIAMDSINLYNPLPDSSEITFVKEQVAQMYLDWGNDLFKKGAEKEIIVNTYIQIARMYPQEYLCIKSLEMKNCKTTQGRAFVLESMIKIYKKNAGCSSPDCGYPSNYYPIWDYSFLRKTTIEYINTAKGLERDLMSYIEKEQEEQDKLFIARQSIATATLTTYVARERQKLDSIGLSIAVKNKEIAELRAGDKKDELERFEDLYPMAVGNAYLVDNINNKPGMDIAAKNLNRVTVMANTVNSELGRYTGSFMGVNTTSTDQLQMNTEKYISLKRERRELLNVIESADLEIDKARQITTISQMETDQADLNLILAEASLRNYQDAIKNKKFYFGDLIKESKNIMDNYIKYAKYLAELTQRAYELEELDNVKVIGDSYLVEGKQVTLAADRLLYDLNTIEYKRITNKKQKESPSTYIISLRNKSMLEMDQLRQTGKITFNISQLDLDNAFPGTYRQLVDDIDVSVIALTDPTGVKGKLTKEGMSWIKVPKSFNENISTEDWMQYTPTNYALLLLKNDPETMLLPKQIQQQTKPDNEGLKTIFEGQGVSGLYTLELPKYSNNFDYNTIADVIIKINFSAYFDEELKKTIEEELCTLESHNELPFERDFSYSIRNDLPDENYYFHNPLEPTEFTDKHRVIPIFVQASDFPINQYNRELTTVSLIFNDGQRAIPVNCKITAMGINKTISFDFQNGRFIFSDPSKEMDDLHWFPNITAGEVFPYLYDNVNNKTIYVRNTDALDNLGAKLFDLWLIRIDADENPDLCVSTSDQIFDDVKLAKIKDVNLHFGYKFDKKYCDYGAFPTVRMMADTVFAPSLPIYGEDLYYYLGYQRKKYTAQKGWKADTINHVFERDKANNLNDEVFFDMSNLTPLIDIFFNKFLFVFDKQPKFVIYLPFEYTKEKGLNDVVNSNYPGTKIAPFIRIVENGNNITFKILVRHIVNFLPPISENNTDLDLVQNVDGILFEKTFIKTNIETPYRLYYKALPSGNNRYLVSFYFNGLKLYEDEFEKTPSRKWLAIRRDGGSGIKIYRLDGWKE